MNASLSEQLGYLYDRHPRPIPKVTAKDDEPFVYYSHRERHQSDCEYVCDGKFHYLIVALVEYICDGAHESLGEKAIHNFEPCDGSCRQPMPWDEEDDGGIGCNRPAGKDVVCLINKFLGRNQEIQGETLMR